MCATAVVVDNVDTSLAFRGTPALKCDRRFFWSAACTVAIRYVYVASKCFAYIELSAGSGGGYVLCHVKRRSSYVVAKIKLVIRSIPEDSRVCRCVARILNRNARTVRRGRRITSAEVKRNILVFYIKGCGV